MARSRTPRSPLSWPLAIGLTAAVSAALTAYVTGRTEKRHPPRGHFVDVAGVRLHYVERGLGIPLVLLHGNASYTEDFHASPLLELAARRYRVIAFDRPGYGYSERPRSRLWTPRAQARLVHAALRQLGVGKAVVLGHSWGALVALAYGALYPADTRALVLLSGYYYPTPRLDWPLFSVPAIPLIGDLARYTLAPWLSRLYWPLLVRRVFAPGPAWPTGRRIPAWMAVRPSQLRATAVESGLLIPFVMDLHRDYRRLQVPVHILAGAADRYVATAWHSARLHRELPGSTYREIAGAGHMLHHVAPEQVLDVVDEAAGEKPEPPHSPAMEDPRQAVEQLPSGADVYGRLKR
jgi:pimeloyl-ACP methyl ester carboxylesterase